MPEAKSSGPPPARRQTKYGPGDYAFLIGMPILFLIIAVLGVRSILGPVPTPHPVEQLREGFVVTGLSESAIRARLGAPTQEFSREDGSTVLRYSRGVWDTNRRTFVQEDADVVLSAEGIAVRVQFDSSTPPIPGSSP